MMPPDPAGPRLCLRPARPDEGPALSALAFDAKAALGYAPAQMKRWREALCIDPGSCVAWVAELAGEAVGTVAWMIDGQRAELTDLWVRPDCQRSGVGARLLALAVAQLRQQGVTRVHIDAEPSAAGFYGRSGARLIGSVPAPIDGDPGRQRPQFELNLGDTPPG